jgi:hypothetical protein
MKIIDWILENLEGYNYEDTVIGDFHDARRLKFLLNKLQPPCTMLYNKSTTGRYHIRFHLQLKQELFDMEFNNTDDIFDWSCTSEQYSYIRVLYIALQKTGPRPNDNVYRY